MFDEEPIFYCTFASGDIPVVLDALRFRGHNGVTLHLMVATLPCCYRYLCIIQDSEFEIYPRQDGAEYL